MAAKKPARKSASNMKSLSKKVTAKEASSVRGGAVAKPGGSIASRVADEAPKETVTFEYGGLNIQYGRQ